MSIDKLVGPQEWHKQKQIREQDFTKEGSKIPVIEDSKEGSIDKNKEQFNILRNGISKILNIKPDNITYISEKNGLIINSIKINNIKIKLIQKDGNRIIGERIDFQEDKELSTKESILYLCFIYEIINKTSNLQPTNLHPKSGSGSVENYKYTDLVPFEYDKIYGNLEFQDDSGFLDEVIYENINKKFSSLDDIIILVGILNQTYRDNR